MYAALGPVGDIDQHIIFRLTPQPPLLTERGSLAAPNRKTQIITNKQIDLPSLHRSDQSFYAWGVVFIFISISKKVAFIIVTVFSIRLHPDKSVEVLRSPTRSDRPGLTGYNLTGLAALHCLTDNSTPR